MFSVAILGASGYVGGELARLLDDHPAFDVVYLGANAKAGMTLGAVHPHLAGGQRRLGPIEPSEVPETDAVFVALPHGASAAVAGVLAERGATVIDLGSDYRLDGADRYAAAYGGPHPFPDRLADWPYGLPEIFGDSLPGADRVAVPGCYPTATVLSLAPLLGDGLIEPEGIIVNALSGVSGAGRSVREDLQFGSVDGNAGAYAVGRHRHRPEIEMALEQASGCDRVTVTFTPHLVPMQRGLLTTSTAPLVGRPERDDLLEALAAQYRKAPFVDVIDGSPQTRWVVGSNRATLSAFTDQSTGQAVVVAAIDNLLKGAAGQAVQIANLALGLEETTGLPQSGWSP